MCKCRICNNEISEAFKATVLQKYEIKYYACDKCGFLQTEEPYWLTESYKESINITDTGLVQRNLEDAELTAIVIQQLFNKQSAFVDMAGGYGLFVRLMRDKGYNFYWSDLYTQNLMAKGFEFDSNSKDKKIELVTAFEAFEHFVDPIKEIENMLSVSKNIFFSTLLYSTSIPDRNWWYYGFEHGQHISFYNLTTLLFLAKKYNLNLHSFNENIHLLTEKKLSYFEKYKLNKRIKEHNLVDYTYAAKDSNFLRIQLIEKKQIQ